MKRYQVRIPLIVAAVMLVVQAALLLACYSTGVGMGDRIAESDFAIHAKSIESSAEISFDMITAVIDAMSNDAVTAFTETSTDLMSEESLDGYAEAVNTYIDSLDIPEGLIDTVMFLGKNYDKVGYLKKIGGKGMVSEVLPTMSHLRFVGLDQWTGLKAARWDYNKDGKITEVYENGLRESGLRVNENVAKKVRFFLNLIEDRVVVSVPTSDGGSQIFLLLNPDFIAEEGESPCQYSLFMDGIPLYSTNQYRNLGSKIAERNTEWSYSVGTRRYMNRSITLTNDSFELIVSEEIHSSDFLLSFPVALPWVVGGSVAMAVILSFVATLFLFRSFKNLGKAFENQFRDGSYQKIEGRHMPGRLKVPMLYRVFWVFLISLMVPSLLSGYFYRKALKDYMNSLNQTYLYDVSESLEEHIREQESYILLTSANLPEREIAAFLRSTGEVTTHLKNRIDAAYRSSGLFTHYAVFDRNGMEIYNTSSTSGTEKLLPNERSVHTNSSLSRVYYVQMVVDNSTLSSSYSPAVVYPIISSGEFEALGYFVLYIDTNRFYELRPGVGHEFVITDRSGQIFFSSIADDRDMLEVTEGAGENLTGEHNFLMISSGKSRFGEKIVSYHDIRIYREQTEGLNSRYFNVFLLVMVFIILTSLFLSGRMTMPLRRIDEDMQSIRDISEITPLQYQTRDEIFGLVKSYNRMVERMSALIAENASRINRENELMAINSRAQLQMLQQQINPHLLYNTLEFISYNAKKEGSTAAGDMAVALADLFRYTTSVKEDIVPFKEELKHIQNYIRIHQLRYGERFDVSYHISPEASELLMMKFTLQPFVENVFKYGIANKLHGALIEISARTEGKFLVLEVADNGLGMRKNKLVEIQERIQAYLRGEDPPAPQKESQGGVGMANVARRLYMYYGERARLEVQSEFMNGFKVTITLPAEKQKNRE